MNCSLNINIYTALNIFLLSKDSILSGFCPRIIYFTLYFKSASSLLFAASSAFSAPSTSGLGGSGDPWSCDVSIFFSLESGLLLRRGMKPDEEAGLGSAAFFSFSSAGILEESYYLALVPTVT